MGYIGTVTIIHRIYKNGPRKTRHYKSSEEETIKNESRI